MKSNNNIILIIIPIILILLISIGISYSFFTANLTGGEESTTITVTGGSMNIYYNSGADISISNIIPSNEPISNKLFNVTGNNTTGLRMLYKLNIIIEENTFSDDVLNYKLISNNNDENGQIIPGSDDLIEIKAGAQIIELGIGKFNAPTDGNKVHTYNLEIYFPNTGTSQNMEQNKIFKAYINIENQIDPCPLGNCITELIIDAYNGKKEVENKPTPNFSLTNGTSGLYAMEDDYGTSYYFRGIKTELNNNLIWGGFQWKILRINGDGSVRIIYNGTEAEFNQNNEVNNLGTNTQISEAQWNLNYDDDAKYLGYMYGGANGVASTSRNGEVSTAATYNETSTNIKTIIEIWYQNNIYKKPFEEDVVDNLFCNDRQLRSQIGGSSTGPGYANSPTTIYAPYHRLYSSKNPDLKCRLKNDRFTQNDFDFGNNNLNYPVGLITADEAAISGLVYGVNNSNNYLYTNQSYWTFSPAILNQNGSAIVYGVSSLGELSNLSVYNPLYIPGNGIRPTLNLSPYVKVTGDGSYNNPYRAI